MSDNISKFQEYKYLISGCNTYADCYNLSTRLKLDAIDKEMFFEIASGIEFKKNLSYDEMFQIIKELKIFKYREEAYAQLPIFLNKTNNLCQIKTFTRIANLLPFKPIVPICESVNKFEIVSKKCPHCDHMCEAPSDTEYIVCGFGKNGYDWDGCGKDWCFKCNKLLCKSWKTHLLFIESNRTHSDDCCKNHAVQNDNIYPDDYCMCIARSY